MQPTMELSETVDLMLSEDPKDRLKAEYYQAENRYYAIMKLLQSWKEDDPDFPIPYDLRAVYIQLQIEVQKYLGLLKYLAKEQDIEL